MEDLVIGRVMHLTRRVVKSMRGEEISSGVVGFSGLVRDRIWVVFDPARRMVITPKLKEGASLLGCRAWRTDGGLEFFSLPASSDMFLCGTIAGNKALSDYLGFRVQVIKVTEVALPLETHFKFSLREGTGFDSSPVHIVTRASCRAVGLSLEEGVQRFRPTFGIETTEEFEGFVEDQWTSARFAIGARVHLIGRKPAVRCPVPGQPNGLLPAEPGLLRSMRRKLPDGGDTKMYLGLYLVVLEPGTVMEGDEIRLLK